MDYWPNKKILNLKKNIDKTIRLTISAEMGMRTNIHFLKIRIILLIYIHDTLCIHQFSALGITRHDWSPWRNCVAAIILIHISGTPPTAPKDTYMHTHMQTYIHTIIRTCTHTSTFPKHMDVIDQFPSSCADDFVWPRVTHTHAHTHTSVPIQSCRWLRPRLPRPFSNLVELPRPLGAGGGGGGRVGGMVGLKREV